MDYDTSIDEKIHQIITAAKESDLDSDEENPPIANFEISKNFKSLYRPKFDAKSYLCRTRNESKIENIPESTQLRRELRDKDRLLNAILFRLRQIPHLNQHLNLENLLSTIDELISQLDEIQNTTREEFSQINAERDKERHHLDELNRRLNCQIENLESQKEKMNSDLHTLTIENEKHKEDLKKLKTQIKNLKNEITMKSDKETQTDLSANQIEGKALAKKDQFITWLKNDNDFLNDEKNKLSDLVVELETHLENQHSRANRYKVRAETAEAKIRDFVSSEEFKLMKSFNAYLSAAPP